MTSFRGPPLVGEELARRHNTPQPVRSLRDWLDHLAARDRLVVAQPGTGAALRAGGHRQAARRPARHAVPAPGRACHPGGVRPRLRPRLDGRGHGRRASARCCRASRRRRRPAAVAGDRGGAGAGGGAPDVDLARLPADPGPQRARRRPLYHRRADDHAQSAHRQAERLDPPLPGERTRTASACCCCRATPTCSSRWPSRAARRSRRRW